MTGDPPIYPFAAAPDDPRWTDGTWGAEGPNVASAYGHGVTPAEVQARGLERIARRDFFTLDEVVEYAGWLLRQTGNQDGEWNREGIVTVYDHEGSYLGCMGIETWRAALAATEPGEPE